MKKTLCVLCAFGLLSAVALPVQAGGRGYYAGPRGYGVTIRSGHGVGEFVAGLVGGAILYTILSNAHAAACYAPPPEYVPPARVWVPGRYETRHEREWVPGHWTDGRPSDRDADDDGYRRGDRTWVPGHYENIRVEVWIPGHWEERG